MEWSLFSRDAEVSFDEKFLPCHAVIQSLEMFSNQICGASGNHTFSDNLVVHSPPTCLSCLSEAADLEWADYSMHTYTADHCMHSSEWQMSQLCHVKLVTLLMCLTCVRATRLWLAFGKMSHGQQLQFCLFE